MIYPFDGGRSVHRRKAEQEEKNLNPKKKPNGEIETNHKKIKSQGVSTRQVRPGVGRRERNVTPIMLRQAVVSTASVMPSNHLASDLSSARPRW